MSVVQTILPFVFGKMLAGVDKKHIITDAIVANPPFSLRWNPTEELKKDFRFKEYRLAPKSVCRLSLVKCSLALIKSTSSLFLHFFKTKIHTGMPVEKNSLAGKPITVSIFPLKIFAL
jgi:flagellar biosynthesis protein FlhB